MAERTPIYALHRWEGSDPVSRAEINENFTLLEQALDAKKTYQLLREVTVSAQTERLTVDASDFDWGRWHEIVIEISAPSFCMCDLHFNGKVTPDGSTDNYASATDLILGSSYSQATVQALAKLDLQMARITFLTGRNSALRPCVMTLSTRGYFIGYAGKEILRWADVRSIDLNCDPDWQAKIPAGTKVSVWGIE